MTIPIQTRLLAYEGDYDSVRLILKYMNELETREKTLREAMVEIQTWCQNVKASTGIKPYGLDIARAALQEKKP